DHQEFLKKLAAGEISAPGVRKVAEDLKQRLAPHDLAARIKAERAKDSYDPAKVKKLGDFEHLKEVPHHEETEYIRTAKVVEKKDNAQAGANASSVVKFENGEKALWKPKEGEATFMRDGIPNYTMWKREAASYEVSKAIGWSDLHAEITVREIDGNVGSIQKWIGGNVKEAQNYWGSDRKKFDGE